MTLSRSFLLLLCSGSLLLASCKKDYDDDNTGPPPPPPGPPAIDWSKAADSSSQNLMTKFFNASGNYFNESNASTNFHYWPQAHALDVLVDGYLRTNGGAAYKAMMDKWFAGVPVKNGGNFFNDFYDDMDWNALAMLRAYEATKDAKWKTAAEAVWGDIKTGWNTTMGGGIAWRKSMPWYKNTPANAPAAILAARLYRLNNNADDLNWARRIYTWQKDSLFNRATGWVYDGMNYDQDGKKQMDWKFTYNQGTFLGAATELYLITNDAGYLSDALNAANFTLSDNVLTNPTDRLLRDEGAGDGGLFKGVFVRYLTQLIQAPGLVSTDKSRYVSYLKFNAETLWNTGTDKSSLLYGTYWKNKPGGTTDLTTQLSGAMLVEAAALLEAKDFF